MTVTPADTIPDDELPKTGYCTPLQAAKFLCISKAAVYRLMDAREIPSDNFGRSRRIPVEALHQRHAKALSGGR